MINVLSIFLSDCWSASFWESQSCLSRLLPHRVHTRSWALGLECFITVERLSQWLLILVCTVTKSCNQLLKSLVNNQHFYCTGLWCVMATFKWLQWYSTFNLPFKNQIFIPHSLIQGYKQAEGSWAQQEIKAKMNICKHREEEDHNAGVLRDIFTTEKLLLLEAILVKINLRITIAVFL